MNQQFAGTLYAYLKMTDPRMAEFFKLEGKDNGQTQENQNARIQAGPGQVRLEAPSTSGSAIHPGGA